MGTSSELGLMFATPSSKRFNVIGTSKEPENHPTLTKISYLKLIVFYNWVSLVLLFLGKVQNLFFIDRGIISVAQIRLSF
jgi:hypothetical protein